MYTALHVLAGAQDRVLLCTLLTSRLLPSQPLETCASRGTTRATMYTVLRGPVPGFSCHWPLPMSTVQCHRIMPSSSSWRPSNPGCQGAAPPWAAQWSAKQQGLPRLRLLQLFRGVRPAWRPPASRARGRTGTSGPSSWRPSGPDRKRAARRCAYYNSSRGSPGADASRFTSAGPYG